MEGELDKLTNLVSLTNFQSLYPENGEPMPIRNEKININRAKTMPSSSVNGSTL